MEKLLSIAMVFGLMIMPVVVYAKSEETGTVYTQSEQTAVKSCISWLQRIGKGCCGKNC
jgi:hypothetical protein